MKKRVLFFIEWLSGGGAEHVIATLLRHFDYEKYDVTLVSLFDEEGFKNNIDNGKIHYRCIFPQSNGLWYKTKYKLLYRWLPARLVARIIIPQGYDVYIGFIEGYTTKIISSVKGGGRKIAWVHIDLKNYPWTLLQGIYKSHEEEVESYREFDKVVCVSHSVENVMKEHYGLTNTVTVYNPIDVGFINQQASDPIDFQPAEGFNIVTVGRLENQKGYDLLIPIIARIRREGYPINLYIIGQGSERKNLETLTSQLSAQEFIHFLGYHNNPHAIVSKMDLFVCSSRAEGYSLVIAEALSLGIAVISTNCSGPNELLADGKYGILCNDYEDLYVRLKEVVTDPSLCEKLHNKALERKKSLDVKRTIDQIYLLI